MKVRLVKESVSAVDLKRELDVGSDGMVKAVVDVERRMMAVGGVMHADAERVLLDDDCRQGDLWGINLYLGRVGEEMIKFQSLINIRPEQKNLSMEVEDEGLRKKIAGIVGDLIRHEHAA